MQPVTKDNCDFPSLRQSKCIYVDKTAWLHRMATDPEAHFFFLARPRRFGKSLMISTLKAMFQGRRDLFEGLAIMDTDWDWERERRPVIHINMGMCAAPRHPPQHGNVRGGGLRHVRGKSAGRGQARTPRSGMRIRRNIDAFGELRQCHRRPLGQRDTPRHPHPCGTYVFELKVDKPPKLAMTQIQRRKYAAPYRAAGKPVWAVGLSFDGKTSQFKGGVAEAVK